MKNIFSRKKPTELMLWMVGLKQKPQNKIKVLMNSLEQSVRQFTSTYVPMEPERPQYTINLAYIGRLLDNARAAKQNAQSDWGKNFWTQVEAQLLRKWNEGVVYFLEPGHAIYYRDVGDNTTPLAHAQEKEPITRKRKIKSRIE